MGCSPSLKKIPKHSKPFHFVFFFGILCLFICFLFFLEFSGSFCVGVFLNFLDFLNALFFLLNVVFFLERLECSNKPKMLETAAKDFKCFVFFSESFRMIQNFQELWHGGAAL